MYIHVPHPHAPVPACSLSRPSAPLCAQWWQASARTAQPWRSPSRCPRAASPASTSRSSTGGPTSRRGSEPRQSGVTCRRRCRRCRSR